MTPYVQRRRRALEPSGSVAEDVLRRAQVPVIVVPTDVGDRRTDGEPLRIVVALDGTDLAEEALGPVCELTLDSGGELVLVRVVEPPDEIESLGYTVKDSGGALMFGDAIAHPPHIQQQVDRATSYLNEVAERVQGIVPYVTVRVEVGQVAEELATVAAATGAHMIAMATHRRGELARLVLGSHAIATLRRAGVPVLMARPRLLVAPDGDVESEAGTEPDRSGSPVLTR